MRAQKVPANSRQMPQFSFPGYTHPVSKKMHYWHLFTYYTLLSWEKLIIILLGLIALRQLFETSHFIISDYKSLELHFSAKSISSAEVRVILNEAIALMVDTIVNLAMAIRLSTGRERYSRVIELIVATAIIIWRERIVLFLQTIDYTLITESVTFLNLAKFF